MTSVTKDGTVQFKFFRPQVREVTIVGDFNGWRRDALHMQPDGEGWWRAETQLHGGDYRFRYLADGTWFTDYASNGIETGKHGFDSLLVVPDVNHVTREIEARHVA